MSQPELEHLFQLFPPAEYLQSFEFVAGDRVPEPYQGLLVHDYHMTVTVEAYHGRLVDVQVLEEKAEGHHYARKILLALQGSGQVVQFGLMRIDLDCCRPRVREEILSRQTPLGRVLIKHNVLRRVEATGFLRIVPAQAMMMWFGIAEPLPTYGRTARIHFDDQPAVEVFEVVAPERG